MAFWWQRRKRWYYRRKPRYKRRRPYNRRPRRRFWRRGNRRPTRRRRRRRATKVKKKKRFLKLLQWQPDSIRKCKIITVDILLLGANGMQHRNYTTDMNEWTLPRTPGGGGFATTVFSLQFLFEQYLLRKNIWTSSNTNYDLCRYTGCKFIFYRHPWWDFIVTAQLMYPMSLNFNDYMETQPLRLLLKQKKIIIPSLKTRPQGKQYIKKKFKPPRQMINKWFFQDMFSTKPLLLLRSAVADLSQPFLGPSGGNELITLTCINIHSCYDMGNWGVSKSEGYTPIATGTNPTTVTINPASTNTIQTDSTGISYDTGWFCKKILQANTIKWNNYSSKYPTYECRYNPKQDTGAGNTVWLCSIQSDHYSKPTTDKVIIAQGQPLWLLLFGFADYIKQIKRPAETFSVYYLLIECDQIHPHEKRLPKTHLIIDKSFINGMGPFNTPVQPYMKDKWYPTLDYQQESISNIVKTGPFIPKPEATKGNWELHYKSVFYFKWGGSLQGDKQINDPSKKKDYDTPDKYQLPIQITDPQKQAKESILHSWDFRRGFITKTALKRMYKHLQASTTLSTDSDFHSPPEKKRFISQVPHLEEEETEDKTLLHSLFEESTYQAPQEEQTLEQLIKQQQYNQQKLKLNLLQLITDLKTQQAQLQLHTGLPS
nr:MAG: ORF1 [Torque teno midi virus]